MCEGNPTVGMPMDVAYVARLARLSLSEAETQAFEQQLEHVLRHFDQIRQVDVTGIEPMAHVIPLENVMRVDLPSAESMDVREVADNAPQWRNGTFVVPRIIE